LLVEQLPQAVEDFTKATELMPKNPLTYVHKLYSEYRQAVNDQDNTKLFAKVEEFSDAIKQYPNCIEVYSLFAQILSDQQQFELADEYFEKAMKLEAGNGKLSEIFCRSCSKIYNDSSRFICSPWTVEPSVERRHQRCAEDARKGHRSR
jgi:tetratricopeptide (TPR) repeat protein